ncbi:DUF6069 family protein [Embleya sp. NPDC008237]|uniref:DUF6069 family protein n=1 Tax=Embleya sp. NPDC008237 TaxID=3363978 RepID=UPI0036EB3FB7
MSTTINPGVRMATSVREERGSATAGIGRVLAFASLAGMAVAGVYEGIVRASGVSLDIGAASGEAEPIPTGGFVGFTAMWALAGVVLALGLARWAKRPGRTYAVITTIVVIASLGLPFTVPHVALSTQLVLAASHLVVAAAVIPFVAARLARVR